MKARHLEGATALILAMVILSCIITAIFATYRESMDSDEFQHVHVAWQVSQGNVLYKDFFDSHGPLYSLINSLAFSVLRIEPGPNVYTFFRSLSLFYTFLTGCLIFRLGKILFQDRITAFIGAAIYATLAIVLDKGIEIRPDTLQNMLWLMSLNLVASDLTAENRYRYFSAGLLLGLAVMANVKAGICVAAITFFFLSSLPFSHERYRLFLSYIIAAAGFVVVVLVTSIGFLMWGAFSDFLRYAFVFPFHLLWHHGEEGHFLAMQAKFFVKDQWPFTFLLLMGFFVLIREFTTQPKNSAIRFLLMITIVSSLLILTGTYTQVYLISLPLLVMIAAYPLGKVLSRIPEMSLRIVVISLVFVPLFLSQVRILGKASFEKRFSQDSLTEEMLRLTHRKEPLGVVWNACGGYVFNANSQFAWMGNYLAWRSIKSLNGERFSPEEFGSEFIDSLERKSVRYIVGEDTSKFSESDKRYLEERFEKRGCLWIRKTPR